MKTMKIFNYGYTKKPERKHSTDAGYDIYLKDKVVIKPNETIAIGCGFGIELPENTMAQIIARSSIAKKGLILASSPVDCGYQGEIHMIITNSTSEEFTFDKDDRLAQMVIIPIMTPELVEGEIEYETERGTGGFGSTNA